MLAAIIPKRLRRTALCIAAASFLHVAAPAAEEAAQELETVIVTGEVPGPGLWKVSKGDHVMWVLANHSPLPKGTTWRSRELDGRIAESQEVLYPPYVNVKPNISMLRGITLTSATNRAAKLPDGKTLKDVLPAEVHERWSELRAKYLGTGDYVETRRPATAMRLLRMYAIRQNELQGGPNVREMVDDARKRHKIKPIWLPTVRRTVEFKDPGGVLDSLRDLQPAEVDCFIRDLDRLEPDIERMKVLANAWSLGDTEELRGLFRPVTLRDEIRDGCVHLALGGAVMSATQEEGSSAEAARVQKLVQDFQWHVEQAQLQAQLDWLKTADAALQRNRTTFALLGLPEILGPDGHLEKLRALGYSVEEPR